MAFGNTKKLCNFFEIYLDRLIYTMNVLTTFTYCMINTIKTVKRGQTYFKKGTIFKKLK